MASLIEINIHNYLEKQNTKKYESYDQKQISIQNRPQINQIKSISNNPEAIDSLKYKVKKEKDFDYSTLPRENTHNFDKLNILGKQISKFDNSDIKDCENSSKFSRLPMKEFLESLQQLDTNPLNFPYVQINKLRKTYLFQKYSKNQKTTITLGSINQKYSDINLKYINLILNDFSKQFEIDKQLKNQLIDRFDIKLHKNKEE